MNTKQKIIEELEGKRAEQIWELIEKAIKEIYVGSVKIPKETKDEYFSHENSINDKTYRFLLIEHYNIKDSFYFGYYENYWTTEKMFEDYFSDTKDSWNDILLVDMEEKKCYLLDKKVSYTKQKVKIK